MRHILQNYKSSELDSLVDLSALDTLQVCAMHYLEYLGGNNSLLVACSGIPVVFVFDNIPLLVNSIIDNSFNPNYVWSKRILMVALL